MPNLLELDRPTPTWTHALLGGNRAAALRANRANLDRARSEVGPIDILHAHVSYPAGWIAMRLSEETGIPYVLTEHMGPFPFPAFLRDGGLSPLVREPLARAARRIVVSDALRAELSRYGFDAIVVPNLVDETFFSPDGGSQRQSEFRFFTLASLLPVKGIDDLLAAAAELDAGSCRLRIGGDGPERERLQRRANELGIADRVDWLGRLTRERLREQYRTCDCFVLPSRHESFGIVLAEATACGKPVVATRSGGPESIVTPENGLLVEVGDVAALAEALQTMVEQARRYDPATIRRQFLERYSRPAVVDALEAVYRGVVAG